MRILANKNPKQNWEKDAKKGLRREKSQMWTERPLIQCGHKISITDTPREGMLQLGSLIWKGLLYFNQDEKLDQKAKNVVWNQQLCWVRGLGKSIQPLQAKWWKWVCTVSSTLTSVWCLIRSWHKFTNILCCWYSCFCSVQSVSNHRVHLEIICL